MRPYPLWADSLPTSVATLMALVAFKPMTDGVAITGLMVLRSTRNEILLGWLWALSSPLGALPSCCILGTRGIMAPMDWKAMQLLFEVWKRHGMKVLDPGNFIWQRTVLWVCYNVMQCPEIFEGEPKIGIQFRRIPFGLNFHSYI